MSQIRQNKLDRDFGVFANGTSITRVAGLFGYSRVTVPNLIYKSTQDRHIQVGAN